MNVALDRDSKRQLKRLVPLNLLPEPDLERLAEYVRFEKLKRGDYLFRQGETEARNVYLLSGSVALLIDGREVDTVSSDSDTARFPLAHQIPRKNSARALGRVDCVSIDSRRLSDLLANTHQDDYQVKEIEAGAADDWMSQLLQSRVFQQIPAANIQSVMMRMEEVQVRAGQEIIQQGGEGDYFYLIHKGRCVVTKRPQPGAKPKELAQLGPGDSFGEEALISGSPRGSTVTMLTNGVLLRLSKEDFIQFVNRPLAQTLSYQEAAARVAKGAIWLDVRSPEMYEAGHLDGSINLPLNTVRYQASALAGDRPYIAYCDTGQQSATAAFLLIQMGFEVSVLGDGIGSAPASAVVKTGEPETERAKVIPLHSAEEDDKGRGAAAGGASEATQRQLLQAEKNIRDLVARVKSLEAENKQISEQWVREGKALKAALEKSKAQIQEFEAHQGSVQEAGQKLQKETATLNEALAKSKAQAEELQALRQSEQEANQKLQKETAALNEALAKSKAQIEELQALRQSEQGSNQGLQTESASLKEALEKSKAQIRELEARQGSVQEADQKLQAEAAALKDGLEQAKSESENLKGELERARGEAENLKAELERAKTEAVRAEREQELQRLEQAQQGEAGTQEIELRSALQAAEKNAKRVAEESETLRRSLETELEELRKQLEESATEQARAEATIRELRDHSAALEQERNQAHGDQEGQTQQIEQLRAELEEAAATIRSLKEDNDRQAKSMAEAERKERADNKELRAELNAMSDTLEEEEQARKAAEKHAAALAAGHEQKEQELNALRDSLDQEVRKTEQATEQIRQLTEALETLRNAASEQKSKGGAAADAAELESVRAELELVRIHATADLNALKEELHTAKSMLHAREQEVAKEKTGHEADRQEVERLRATLEQREKQIKRAETERRHLEDAIEDRNAEIDRLRHEAEEALLEAEEAGYGRKEAEEARKQVEEALYELKSDLEKESSRRENIIARMHVSGDASMGGAPSYSGSSRRQILVGGVIGAVLLFVLLEGALILTGQGELVTRLLGGRLEGIFGEAEYSVPSAAPSGPGSAASSQSGQTQPAATDGAASTANPAPSKPATGSVLRDVAEGPVMLRINGERFSMGSDRSQLTPDEQPVHWVELQDFAISRNEVTFEEYDRFARDTGRRLPSDNGWGRGNRPVINVSWNDAVAYAAWLSRRTGKHYRLPSEAEWEYVARAGTDTLYWWGYQVEKGHANCFECGSQWDRQSTAPVGSFKPNPYGVQETAGNVREWVQDCYHGNYRDAPAKGEAWVEDRCDTRVVRGGAYDKPADAMRPTWRGELKEEVRLPMLGFRLARDL
jgi:formylglycine-generating enzyme required for sulfatase activity/CRP-like cAMP-binding protein